jgi:4'-phosphopantetheinyl transferase EntD
MIERLLLSAVVAVEAFGDLPELFDFPTEKRLVAGDVEKWRREFITVRRCAHEALQRMGIIRTPIGAGADHAPLWPAGLVGSITHCDGYRAAAVARRSEIGSIGIDAEVDRPLPAGVGDVVLRPGEHPQPDHVSPSDHEGHRDRLLFSCKEATCKAWYPLTGRWPRTGEPPSHSLFHGKYAANAQLIVTTATVDPSNTPTGRASGIPMSEFADAAPRLCSGPEGPRP